MNTLLDQAKSVLAHSYSPYSNFQVAACIACRDPKEGSLATFVGVNVENASYGLTQCAEACAIGSMVSAGFTQIDEMLVIASTDKLITPCGACRQQIAEFAHADTRIHLCQGDKVAKSLSISELLPYTFDFEVNP